MKRIAIVCSMLVIALALGACESVGAKYGEDMQLALEAYVVSLAAFQELDENSSEQQVKDTIDELYVAWADFEQAAAAEGIEIPRLQQAMAAFQELIESESPGVIAQIFDAQTDLIAAYLGLLNETNAVR